LKRWLADFRVQSELTLPSGLNALDYADPHGLYEIRIKETGGPIVEERLSAEITFSAPDIAAAEFEAKEHLQKFLHLLSFVTSCAFKITRKIALVDWRRGGSFMRDAYVYGPSDSDDALKGLSAPLLKTVETLKLWGTTPLLETALRWYASGVRSTIMEDQFQLFWFVIEIIGTAEKNVEKVIDKCVRCGGELCCTACGAMSEHRPFAKQKISAMLTQGDIPQLRIDDLFYVRNALLHGTPREEIEKKIQDRDSSFSFDKIVDFTGRTAWHLILYKFEKPPGEHRPDFLQVSTYVDWQLSAKAHVQIPMGGDPNNPRYDSGTLPKVWIHRGPGEPKPPV